MSGPNLLKELISHDVLQQMLHRDNPFLRLWHKFTFKNNKLYYIDRMILIYE